MSDRARQLRRMIAHLSPDTPPPADVGRPPPGPAQPDLRTPASGRAHIPQATVGPEVRRPQLLRLLALTRSQEMVNAYPEAVYGIDGNGRCVFANHLAGRMFGYRLDELIGADIHTLIHHSNPDGTPLSHDDCPILAMVRQRNPMEIGRA